jgi:hypothetical protein
VQKCITQKVQTREQVLNESWEMDLEVGPRTVDRHVGKGYFPKQLWIAKLIGA